MEDHAGGGGGKLLFGPVPPIGVDGVGAADRRPVVDGGAGAVQGADATDDRLQLDRR